MAFRTVTKVVTKKRGDMADSSAKTATRKHLTDIGLRALKAGETATEPLAGRGTGALLFKCRDSGVVEVYYRRRDNGRDQLIKLGIFKKTPKSPGFGLSELRDQAMAYARIAAEHGDIKTYLAKCAEEKQEHEMELQRYRHEQRRIADAEAATGSFAELFRDYIEDRKSNGVEQRQIKEFERLFKAFEIVAVSDEDVAPMVMALKAKDVRPENVKRLLSPIWDRGSTRQAGKARSFLVAAFNYGLKAEHHIARSSQKSYGLLTNPAEAVVVPTTSKPGTRALTDDELRQFWLTITEVPSVGPIMARVFQFAFAIAGQRPEQFIREPWTSYDLKKKQVTVIDGKGRGGIKRVHIVPLTERAMGILEEVRALQPEGAIYPWSIGGIKPIHSSSLSHAVKDWRESKHSKLGDDLIPKFTPRDFRRTCTQLMQRHGIKDVDSDVLQSHGQTGVVGTHYRNNAEARLPAMRIAMSAFDDALGGVLSERKHDLEEKMVEG